MKKLAYLSMMLVAMFIMAACSDDKPSDAFKSYITAFQNGDYEKFVDGINFTNVEPENMSESKEGFTAMVKEKGENLSKQKGGIKDVEILSEEISEDGNTAVIKYKEIYGDGSEEEKEGKMIKVDGKWKMDMGK